MMHFSVLAPRAASVPRHRHQTHRTRPTPTFPRFTGTRNTHHRPNAVFDPTQYDAVNNTHIAKTNDAQQYGGQGSNVYHEAQMGTQAQAQQVNPNQPHAPMSNPGEPDYLPHLQSTRQRFIDQEASAVRVRDYPVASRSAKILQRLVEIERDLMVFETQEMEASLASDYQTAAVAKRRKDGLLEEFYDLRFDKYDESRYADGLGVSSGSGASSSQPPGVNNAVSNGAVNGSNTKAVTPLNTVPVRFTVNVQPQFGESVVVCGDVPELGAWDGTKGVPMEYKLDTKTWSCTVGIPQSSSFSFKFVVVGGLSPEEEAEGIERALFWQEGADRIISLPFDDALSLDVVVDWEGDSEQERMWLCMPVPKAPKGEVE